MRGESESRCEDVLPAHPLPRELLHLLLLLQRASLPSEVFHERRWRPLQKVR